jgi:hypothetical protein
MGAHRVFIGLADQYFDFTRVDGVHLSNIPIAAGALLGPGTSLTGNYNVHLKLNQFTIFGSYGLTNRLDVSVAVPIVSSQMSGSLNLQANGLPFLVNRTASLNPSATGIGDVQFQVKGNIVRTEQAGLAFGVNLRTPTGDAYNLLGAGAMGIEPFLAASVTLHHRLTPHVNVGYQWNGKSVLTGNLQTETTRSIAGNISYVAGTEIAINRRVTATTDIIGEEVIHGDRIAVGYFGFAPQGQPVEGTLFYRHSFNNTSGSVGVKVNPGGNFLIVANLLFRMNHGGLSAPVVPLIGLSYVR